MNRHEKERENGKHQGENIWDLYDSHRKQWIINFKNNKKQSSEKSSLMLNKIHKRKDKCKLEHYIAFMGW